MALSTDLAAAQDLQAALKAHGASPFAQADAAQLVADLTAQSTPPKRLITGADFTWLYDFALLPVGGKNCNTFSYLWSGISYNPANNSLFISGTVANNCGGNPLAAEVSIPPNGSKPTLIQGFADPSQGIIGRYFNDQGARWGAFCPYKGAMLMAMYGYYDANGAIKVALAQGSLNLSAPNATGPFGLTCSVDGRAVPAGAMGGWIEPIPSDWFSYFPGCTHFCGNGGIPIISRTSSGPAAIGFNADDLAGLPANGNATGHPYIFYPIANPMPGFDPENVPGRVAWSSTAVGLANVNSSTVYGIVGVGVQPVGLCWYGFPKFVPGGDPREQPPQLPDGSYVSNPCNPAGNKGNQSQGKENVIWVYDPAVVATAAKSYSLTPAQFDLKWQGQQLCSEAVGVAHDRSNCLFYVMERGQNPVVHVLGYPK